MTFICDFFVKNFYEEHCRSKLKNNVMLQAPATSAEVATEEDILVLLRVTIALRLAMTKITKHHKNCNNLIFSV
jgi:hypothetical protein